LVFTASNLDRAVLAAVSAMSPEDLRRVPDVSEGIENRILCKRAVRFVAVVVNRDTLHSLRRDIRIQR